MRTESIHAQRGNVKITKNYQVPEPPKVNARDEEKTAHDYMDLVRKNMQDTLESDNQPDDIDRRKGHVYLSSNQTPDDGVSERKLEVKGKQIVAYSGLEYGGDGFGSTDVYKKKGNTETFQSLGSDGLVYTINHNLKTGALNIELP